MRRIAKEYSSYVNSNIMKKLATLAHGKDYCEQTSSATFVEISKLLSKYHINSSSTVLDLGCGNGTFSVQVASAYACSVCGIDVSHDLIKLAKSKLKLSQVENLCKFEVCDFSHLNGIKDDSYDFIIVIGSLYWNPNLNEILNLWRMKLKKDGKLIIFINMKYAELNNKEKEAVSYTVFIDNKDMFLSLQLNGLKVVELQDETLMYLKWLNKWCAGLDLNEEHIIEEMGEELGRKMMNRFYTYRDLAENGKVRRIILIASKQEGSS